MNHQSENDELDEPTLKKGGAALAAVQPLADEGLTAEVVARPTEPRPIWRRQLLLHAYLGETALLIGVLAVWNLAYMPAQPGFLGIEPNPFWIPILLMATRYGFRAGLVASLASAAVYLSLIAASLRQQLVSYRDLMSWSYAKPAVLFVAAGVVLGMLVQRHRDRSARLQRENEALSAENRRLRRGEEELRDVNVELAQRVVGATETLPMLYRYAKKLNDLDVSQIYTALTDLVVEVIRAGRCAVYVLEGGRLIQHSENGQRRAHGPELDLGPELVSRLLGKRQVLSLHDLIGLGLRRQDLLLCGPLSAGAGGPVMALLCVHELEFLRYSPATLRLFGVIVDWACASLEKAAQYRQQPEALRMAQAKASLLRARSKSVPPLTGGGDELTQVQLPSELRRLAAGRQPAAAEEAAPAAAEEVAPAATEEAAPAAPVGLVPAGVGASALSQVLSQASHRLFGGGNAGLQQGLPAGVPGQDPTLEELQRLMSGELQVAQSQGSPLAKLLAEIDGYVTGRGERGG